MARNKYLVKIVVIGDNQHFHVEKTTNALSFEADYKNHEGKDIKIKVEPKDLYEIPINFFAGLLKFIWNGQVRHYLLVVNTEGKPIKEIPPATSGKVLLVARDWRGLGKAISDSFGSNWEIPRVGLIIAIGAGLLIFGVLVWRGFIPLPRSWTQ